MSEREEGRWPWSSVFQQCLLQGWAEVLTRGRWILPGSTMCHDPWPVTLPPSVRLSLRSSWSLIAWDHPWDHYVAGGTSPVYGPGAALCRCLCAQGDSVHQEDRVAETQAWWGRHRQHVSRQGGHLNKEEGPRRPFSRAIRRECLGSETRVIVRQRCSSWGVPQRGRDPEQRTAYFLTAAALWMGEIPWPSVGRDWLIRDQGQQDRLEAGLQKIWVENLEESVGREFFFSFMKMFYSPFVRIIIT